MVVVADEDRGFDAVRRATRKDSDALIWIERPDVDDPTTDRCGEADLFVYRHRRRMQTNYVAYQERYGQFINVMTRALVRQHRPPLGVRERLAAPRTRRSSGTALDDSPLSSLRHLPVERR